MKTKMTALLLLGAAVAMSIGTNAQAEPAFRLKAETIGATTPIAPPTDGETELDPPAEDPGIPPLFAFASHTFGTCGARGMAGPSISTCRSTYADQAWAAQAEFFRQGRAPGFQVFTVPDDGRYRLAVAGASGGMSSTAVRGGLGALLEFEAVLARGQVVEMIVGQRGTTFEVPGGGKASGGGGGTFVSVDGELVAAAGGGGGFNVNANGTSQRVNSDADPESPNGKAGFNPNPVPGGTAGRNGADINDNIGGGAGYLSSGIAQSAGRHPAIGAAGGRSAFSVMSQQIEGGFGGGGAGAANEVTGYGGGAGGWSGGGADARTLGGGAGGSLIAANEGIMALSRTNGGVDQDGYVTIRLMD